MAQRYSPEEKLPEIGKDVLIRYRMPSYSDCVIELASLHQPRPTAKEKSRGVVPPLEFEFGDQFCVPLEYVDSWMPIPSEIVDSPLRFPLNTDTE